MWFWLHRLLVLHMILVARTFGIAYSFGCMDFYRCTDFWLHAILTIEIKKHGINRAFKVKQFLVLLATHFAKR
mgnify:CR=1 FL=1